MSHNTLKIEKDNFREHSVILSRSTVSDVVVIKCGSKSVCLEQDEFKALAHLMNYDFYTRGMIEEAQEHSRNDVRPYNIYSTPDIEGYDEKINWNLAVENNDK